MFFWMIFTLFSQTFYKQAVVMKAHTCVFIQELILSSMCLSMWSRCSLFLHYHLDCFQLIMPLKNVKNACQFYIRTGITSCIFNFIAKNILFLESFYWTLLLLMSIWISPAVQSAFLGSALWEAGYTCSLSLKHLNYNLRKSIFSFL